MIIPKTTTKMTNKKEVAQKMIKHTHFDRKTGKYVRTMVPQTPEHAAREKSINTAMKKATKNGKFHVSDLGS